MALVRKGSRRIVVDGMTYRWRLRGRPTYFQGLAWSPCTFAVEHVATPGTTLVVTTDQPHPSNWIGREAELHCRLVLPWRYGSPCVRVGPRRLRAPRSTWTGPPASQPRFEREHRLRSSIRSPLRWDAAGPESTPTIAGNCRRPALLMSVVDVG